MKNILYVLLIVLSFVSCTGNAKIEKVLDDSGRNGIELLKVLEHYKKNKEDSFNFLGDSIVYLPMRYKKQELVPFSNPIILFKKNVKLLNPSKSKFHKVILTRKYPFSNNWTNKWSKLIGGKFEVSNDSLFINRRTLYTIDNVPVFRNVINFNGKIY